MPTRTLYKWNEHWGNTFHCLPADVQKHFNMHLAINIKRCYRGNQIDAKSGCWSGFMGKKSHREKYGACLIRDKQPWAYVSRPPCMPPRPPTHPLLAICVKEFISCKAKTFLARQDDPHSQICVKDCHSIWNQSHIIFLEPTSDLHLSLRLWDLLDLIWPWSAWIEVFL